MRINMNINSIADSLKSKVPKIIFTFLLLCAMFSFSVFAQDENLDEETASAFMEELINDLQTEVEDQDNFDAILEKWESRDLVGKTKKQAIDILFADVKSVVKDTAITNKLLQKWNAKSNTPGNVEKPPRTEIPKPQPTSPPQTTPSPHTTPEPDEPTDLDEPPKPPVTNPTNPVDPNPATPVNRPATVDPAAEEMIDLGAPPLSEGDMEQVMKWIAVRTGALRLPFCWKQSYGRTAGTPMICKPGYNQDTAGLCYKNCAADERGIATFCYKNCPQGLPDNGLYCEKRGEYGRGAGYPIWDEGRCNKDNPQGCEKSGLIWYPKCKPGYAPFGCCLCKPACPQGWEDIGVSCKKPNYAREVLPLTECPAGTERNGALCYPICKNDFAGNGPVCWQRCPSQQSWDCGAACSTNQKECGMAVLKQVTAPIMAVISIVSLGSASAATGAAKAAQIGASVSKLAAAVDKVKKALTAVKGSVEALVGGAKNLANIQKAIKIGGKLYVAATAVGRQVDLFSKEFADNFDTWTSPEIAKEIDSRFGKEAAFQIKRQWGLRHLSMMLEVDGFATGKNVLMLVSVADPTGVVAVAEAFMHPVCKSDSKFPNVTALYNH